MSQTTLGELSGLAGERLLDLGGSTFESGDLWPTREDVFELEPELGLEVLDEATPAVSLAACIASVAEVERQRWELPGGRSLKETDPAAQPMLRSYWRTVLSESATDAAIRSRSPWSAAFISYVMRCAGVECPPTSISR